MLEPPASNLYLTSSGGQVWWCDDDNSPSPSSLAVSAYVNHYLVATRDLRVTKIFVRYSNENLSLICFLCRLLEFVEAHVYVCRPRNGEPDNPAAALGEFRRQALARDSEARLFRLFHEDSHNYEFLRDRLAAGSQHPFDYRTHPVFTVRQFLPFGCDEALQEVIASVVDPRFFYNERKITRMNKLFRFLGLTPSRFSLGLPIVKAWFDVDRIEEARDKKYFFYDYWIHLPERLSANRDNRFLRTTRKFATFVSLVWLSKLLRPRTRRDLFDPMLFFQDVRAFNRYQAIDR